MSAVEFLALVLAGFSAGLAGSIAGLASLISYPALLAVGLNPVAANVTNTVALVFGGVGSALSSRVELSGQGARLRRLGPVAILGGATGGTLLLLTPASSFARIVPWLIAFASAAILVRRTQAPARNHSTDRDGPLLTAGVFVIAIYGGYFGAAAGVLLLALLLSVAGSTMARSNATKNAVLGLANGIAALGFVVFGPVQWSAVLPLAAGFLCGGFLGPAVVRRAPVGPLRIAIGVAGLGLAVKLGYDAYR